MPMTGKPTDLNLEQWCADGVARGARAMFVVWDMFPFPPEAHPLFIAADEHIGARFAAVDGVGMQRVSAVHLLRVSGTS